MKILSFIDLTEQQQSEILELSKDISLEVKSPEEASKEDLTESDVIYGWSNRLNDHSVANGHLKWIQTIRAGVDALPLDHLREEDIVVTSGSGANAINIAEQTLAYMLMFVRKLHLSMRDQDNDYWNVDEPYDEVFGKKVLIVGAGNIGSILGRYCKALGMSTIGIRRTAKPTEYMDEMMSMDQLSEAVGKADFVVNILPDTKDTVNIFDKVVFEKMQKNSIYINIGRGKTTDTNDLIDALESGQIAGAALDVFEPEPLPADNPLWDMKNVIVTPHNAGRSKHYAERAFKIFKKNLKSLLENGEVAENVVDLKRGY
ncbi:D-2-hydroxyacid dehydrogenase [Companilactobacillus ginsenosidimutans]|uniref:Hydroxyacid dehydrogenase n=1 Tax=Companilactobacillus ginsenosidimutans TaxID=1007676 RepID=A0A0H4QKQ2_9LACO|nr:D-2-hydroxyacid dehydrogenase [Companilactobacillus ginsenosidimutans]AKP67298.1 hydroxyacid dehydrogenase [Companilactobacillus ginsenosidimutans]